MWSHGAGARSVRGEAGWSGEQGSVLQRLAGGRWMVGGRLRSSAWAGAASRSVVAVPGVW